MWARASVMAGVRDGSDAAHGGRPAVLIEYTSRRSLAAVGPCIIGALHAAVQVTSMERLSGMLGTARGIFGLVGIGAIVMAASNLSSGQSLADPVFPAGIAMGLLAIGAARWVDAPQPLAAIATWLGILAVAVALVIFWSFLLRTPSLDAIALAGVPTLILLAAAMALVVVRLRTGPFGAGAGTRA
jgi:hypothetical protein